MELELDLNKNLEENASAYFDKAKKLKKKITGIKKALGNATTKLDAAPPPKKPVYTKKKTHWYEKFHWFHTTTGKLALGGRDATTNDILIKKHLADKDIVFHTEMAGSPFFVLICDTKPTEEDIQETAQATAIYSRAWKLGLTETDVYYVTPDQVSQEAPSGEYISKGAFMIYGKKTFLTVNMEAGIALTDTLTGGPWQAIKRYNQAIKIIPGDTKVSDLAKTIKHRIGYEDLDAIIRLLPTGGATIDHHSTNAGPRNQK